jgi:Nuclease-related domain
LGSAADNAAFRAAARSVWPGTEDRLARPAAPAPSPASGGPGSPGVASFGPLGTISYEEASRQVWEPRRLYKEPLLRPRRRPDSGPPRSPGRQHPDGPQPESPGSESPRPGAGHAEPGTEAAGARSDQTAAPSQPRTAQPETESRPALSGVAAPPAQRRDIPVRRLAITAGSGATPGSSSDSLAGSPGSGPDGPERRADRLRLGDLLADSRMRIWKRRLLVAIVAGLVFTFIFTWRAGLTAAVLAGIADAVYRSRTTASMPPGVRLTGAQKRTQRQLARMERAGYRALHSRPIPGSREFIDHFVVGPTGAYAIDSESWDKRLPIRTKNARQIWHGPFSKKDRLEHARWEAQQATDRLTAELGTQVYVRPVLAVYGPKVPWHFATIREVDVFDGDRLRKYLRRNGTLKDRPKLTAGEVDQIYAAAAQVLPLNGAAQHTPVG